MEGDRSVDDLGVAGVDELVLEITFEGKIDYEQFMLNLTSYALVPLREDIVSRSSDWSEKACHNGLQRSFLYASCYLWRGANS